MEEFDKKVSDRAELAETSEMTTEELEEHARRSRPGTPDAGKKTAKAMPRKELEALKDLFSGDE